MYYKLKMCLLFLKNISIKHIFKLPLKYIFLKSAVTPVKTY